MLRYYAVDLLDWHRGRLSTRRLGVLLRHLPRDSEVNRALHGEAAEWGVADYLMAAAVDHLAAANWMTATLNRDEDEDPLEYPEPVPRPGTTGEDTPDADTDPENREKPESAVGADASPNPDGDRLAPAKGPSPAELARFFG